MKAKHLSNRLFFFIAITPIFLPAYLIKIKIKSEGSVNLLDILLSFNIFILLILFIKKHLTHFYLFKKFCFRNIKIFLPFLFLIASLIFSFCYNASYKNWQDGLGVLKSFYLLPIIFAFLSNYTLPKTFKTQFIFNFFLCSVFLAQTSLLMILFNKGLTFDHRLTFLFDSPNQLAIFLTSGACLGFGFFFLNKEFSFFKNSRSYRLVLIALSLLFFVIFLTKSLGAFIGIFFLIAFLIANKYLYTRSFLLLIKILIGFSLSLFLCLPLILKNHSYSPFLNRNSFDSRLVIWLASHKIVYDHWFFGIGATNFQNKYLEYQKYFLPYPQWAVPHSHNIFISLWLEAGILGLLSFLWILWTKFDKIKIGSLNKKNGLQLMLFGVLIYFLIHGTVDTTYWKNDLAVIFWVILFWL